MGSKGGAAKEDKVDRQREKRCLSVGCGCGVERPPSALMEELKIWNDRHEANNAF